MVHNIWKINLFERKQGELSNIVVCKECRKSNAKCSELKIADRSVTGFVRHLKQHPNYKKMFDKLEDKSGEVDLMENFVVRPSGGLSSLDKKVINYVAENCISFNSIESRPFVSLFNTTNSSEKLKKSWHYSDFVLPRAYGAVVCLIRTKLEECEWLSFPTDIWTSQSGHAFISLTSHGIDQDWKRIKHVFAIHELSGSHTAECINSAIKKILQEWKIQMQMSYLPS